MSAPDLAQSLRLKRAGNHWRGDCPACGYAGTFSVTSKGGRTLWHCASCQNGGALGGEWTPPATPARARAVDPASRIRAALALWNASVPTPGTLAAVYLAARGLAGEASPALRFHPALRHPNVSGTFPAMVALVVSTETGEPVAIHRTYLRRDGTGKAAIDPAKASKGTTRGGAIMLHAPMAGAPLVIGEGIESSLSAGRIMGAAAWAGIAAGNLRAMIPPAQPAGIIIAADHDAAGQREAWAAADAWRAHGRLVRVATPDTPGEDFNDLWRARMAREANHG